MRNVPSAFRANLAIAAAIASACFGCARSAIRLKDASIDRLGKSSDSADRSADVGGAGGIDGGVSGLDGAAGESSSQAKDALVEWTGDSAATCRTEPVRRRRQRCQRAEQRGWGEWCRVDSVRVTSPRGCHPWLVSRRHEARRRWVRLV